MGKWALFIISLMLLGCWRQEPRMILPMYTFVSLPEYGYITAQGTWEAVNFQMAYPTNLVQLQCDFKTKTCRVFSVDFGKESYGYRAVPSLDVFDVTDWNNRQIKAEADYSERKSVIAIDLKNEIITLDSYPIKPSASQEIRHMVLVDGFKKSFEEKK